MKRVLMVSTKYTSMCLPQAKAETGMANRQGHCTRYESQTHDSTRHTGHTRTASAPYVSELVRHERMQSKQNT